MKLQDRNKAEEWFHDSWAKTVDLEVVSPEKYFTAPTALECRLAAKLMGPLKGKKILDLGCGFGEASVWFAIQGADVFALDISAQMLDCVKVLAARYKVKDSITFIRASAEKIPLGSESVDLIFGGNVLHHTEIGRAAKEVERILKPRGKAIFVEPLAYNPLIEIYRKMSKDLRTKMEKPFTFNDVESLSAKFGEARHYELQLFTTLIFVWFFLGERLHPNKVRYWKRFIEKGENYETAFRFLNRLDNLALKVPFLKRYCWNTVIELVK